MSEMGFLIWMLVWIVGGLGAAITIILWRTTNRVQVRERINEKTYIRGTFWIREKKDRETGILYWNSVLPGFKNPAPPGEVVDTDRTGRKWAVAYKVGEDQYVWARDEWDEHKKNSKVLKAFVPFSSTDREVLMSQYKKSEMKRTANVLKEVILPALAILAPTILCVILVVYWEDFTKSGKEIAQLNIDSQRLNQEMQLQNIKLAQALGIRVDGTVAQTADSGTPSTVIIRPDERPPTATT